MRALLFVGTVLLLPLPGLAQSGNVDDSPSNSDLKRLRIGFDIGVSLSKYYGDTLAGRDRAAEFTPMPAGGVNFSLLLDDDIKSQLYLETGIYFQSRGTRYTWTERFTNTDQLDSVFVYDETQWLGYAQLPVLARIEIGADEVKPFVSIGGFAAYNLIGQRTRDAEWQTSKTIFGSDGNPVRDASGQRVNVAYSNSGETSEDIDDIEPLEYGIIVAAGLKIPLSGQTRLSIQGRYDLGISNAYDTVEADKRKNQSINFFAGLDF
jgi:hypothetical protein